MTSDGTFLDDLRIASPCKASWDEMQGDDRSRFCGICEKHVYDLRFMSRDEAEDMLRDKGEACVRMARRADGTVITSDCPVGASNKAKRQRTAALVGGGLLAASALLWKLRPESPALRDGGTADIASFLHGEQEHQAKPAPEPKTKPEKKPEELRVMTGMIAPPKQMPEPEPLPQMLMGDVSVPENVSKRPTK